MDRNSPANAGDMGLIPGPGRFQGAAKACVPRLPRPCSRARAPQQEKPLQVRRRRPATKSGPHSLQKEKDCTQQQRPSTIKNK